MNDIKEIAALVRRGGTILYPTDTVWGIGCDATNAEAVANIYALKQRDEQKAMIVLMESLDMVAKYFGQLSPVVWELMEAIESDERPTTVVLPGAGGVASNLLPSEGTLAVRIPKSTFCRQLIRSIGRPLVSTSANVSGEATPLGFSQISATIISGVDGVVDRSLDDGTGRASAIVSIDGVGSVRIIRA